MKQIAFMVALGVAVWGSDVSTIQVISAQKESSITPAFQKKVQSTGLKSTKNKENDRYVVTVGTFKDKAAASKAVSKVRNKVACDAFVRPVERHLNTAAAETKSEKSKIVSKDASVQKVAAVAKAVEEPKKEAISAPEKVEAVAKAVEKPAEMSQKPEIQNKVEEAVAAAVPKEVAAPKMTTAFVVMDNKALYKHEIAEAIQFYKNSPYHRFEPSGVKR